MNRINLSSTLQAGVIATTAMTVLTLVAPMMGLPKMDIPGMLAGFMGVPIIIGWFAHYMIGTVLAFGYALLFANRVKLPRAIKGAVYGTIPWLMAQIIVMPMMGAPLYSGSAVMAGASLMGHMVYGAVLGVMYHCRHSSESADCGGPLVVGKHKSVIN